MGEETTCLHCGTVMMPTCLGCGTRYSCSKCGHTIPCSCVDFEKCDCEGCTNMRALAGGY